MIDYFGFLNLPSSICFDGVRIVPREGFAKIHNYIESISNKNGYIYPPMTQNVEVDITTMETKRIIPNTEKPAILYKLPFSHSINIENPFYKKDLRKWDYSFLVNSLAFVNGTRLQFYNWYFDNRVPTKNTDNIHLSPNGHSDFFQTIYETWKSWSEINKARIINLLALHSRIPSYEWDFERFMLNYMVFDGAYSIAEKVYICKSNSHKNNFHSVIDKFGLINNDAYIDNIYNLRNDLFHHAIWDGGSPTSAADKYKGWMHEITLRKFNLRFIIALLNYKTDFIATPWWTIMLSTIDPHNYNKKANVRRINAKSAQVMN